MEKEAGLMRARKRKLWVALFMSWVVLIFVKFGNLMKKIDKAMLLKKRFRQSSEVGVFGL